MELNSAKTYTDMREHYLLQLPGIPYAGYDEPTTFDIAEGDAHMIPKLKSLSANELRFVAEGYPHDPIEYKHPVEIAANPCPQNRIVNIQTLSVALSASHMTGAKQYLELCYQQPELWNNLGGYTIEHDDESAQPDFQKAINTENVEAICNLPEINRRRDALRLLID